MAEPAVDLLRLSRQWATGLWVERLDIKYRGPGTQAGAQPRREEGAYCVYGGISAAHNSTALTWAQYCVQRRNSHVY